MPTDPLAVLGFTASLFETFAPLGARGLKEAERKRIGGSLFRGGPAFVRAVAQALDAGCFPQDAGDLDGAALRAQQGRAAAWLQALTALDHLRDLARDSYLQEQGEAIARAMTIVQRHRHQAAEPGAPPGRFGPGTPLARQAQALAPALGILKRRQQVKRRQAQRRARAGSRPASSPSPSP